LAGARNKQTHTHTHVEPRRGLRATRWAAQHMIITNYWDSTKGETHKTVANLEDKISYFWV
jgi:hypothetical protein